MFLFYNVEHGVTAVGEVDLKTGLFKKVTCDGAVDHVVINDEDTARISFKRRRVRAAHTDLHRRGLGGGLVASDGVVVFDDLGDVDGEGGSDPVLT